MRKEYKSPEMELVEMAIISGQVAILSGRSRAERFGLKFARFFVPDYNNCFSCFLECSSPVIHRSVKP